MNLFNLRPNSTRVLYEFGSYLYLRGAAGAVQITLRDGRDQILTTETLFPGQGLRGVQFEKIDVKNLHRTNSEIEIYTSNAQLIDNRMNGEFNVQIRQGAGVRNSAQTVGATEKLILPADQFRLKVVVTNTGDSVAFIGGNINVSTVGTPINPGEKFTIERAANTELWAISPTETELRIWEEVDTALSPIIGPDVITTNSGAPITVNGEPLTVRNI